jgi:ectoine hydroxylase-related dioxygenase (phytanoyl-CoA dioxygenase family)
MTGFEKSAEEFGKIFEDDGVVCVRNALQPDWLEKLRDAMEDALRNPKSDRNKIGQGYFFETGLWRSRDPFKKFAFESGIAETAAHVMRSATVRMYNDTLFVKEPGSTELTPWHHDLPYFKLGGKNNCSAWIALDPANQQSGAMTYAVGSHRWGKMFRPTSFGQSGGDALTDDLFDGVAPDIDAEPGKYATVSFDVQPGDVVFHHLLTLHKAGVNATSGTRRRVHTIRFAGDDAIFVNRPFSTVEFETDLTDGSPLGGPMFPIVWQRVA